MIITTSSTWSSLVIEMITTSSVMIMIRTSSSPKFWFECECFRLTRPQWDTAVGCLLARSTVQGGQIHIRIFRICEFEFEFVFVFVKAGSNCLLTRSAFQKEKFIFQSVFVENCVKSISITSLVHNVNITLFTAETKSKSYRRYRWVRSKCRWKQQDVIRSQVKIGEKGLSAGESSKMLSDLRWK